MSMSKYDKMLEENRKKSEDKIGAAKLAIRDMIENGEKISVPKLMKKTGLSRGFFYKNPTVRAEIDEAMEMQGGIANPRKEIIDRAMDERIDILTRQNAELKRKILELEQKNEKLQKALSKKELNILKNL